MKKKYRIVKREINCQSFYYIQYKKWFKWKDTAISSCMINVVKNIVDEYRNNQKKKKQEIIKY